MAMAFIVIRLRGAESATPSDAGLKPYSLCDLLAFVSEERLTQTIERPQAICVISGLPTTALTDAGAAEQTSSKAASEMTSGA
jgi:hypothetical protein